MQPHEIFIKNNYFLYRKDENKEKEVANGPFLKIPCSSIQNVDSSSIAFHIIWTHERAILNLILDEKNLPHRQIFPNRFWRISGRPFTFSWVSYWLTEVGFKLILGTHKSTNSVTLASVMPQNQCDQMLEI